MGTVAVGNIAEDRQTTANTAARDQWRVCLHGRFPAYISWQEFESIEAMLRDNYAEYKRNRTRGVPREGKALLQGIAYCGECGHKLGVQYKRRTQYLCNFFRAHDCNEPPCQRLPADLVDEQVMHRFFEALSAAEIDLSARVLAEGDRTRDQVLAARRQEVERLRYQARLADRQFQRSDSDNRLVTAELERRWEEALRACQEAENRLREEETHAPVLGHSCRSAGTVEKHRSACFGTVAPQAIQDIAKEGAASHVDRQGCPPPCDDGPSVHPCRLAGWTNDDDGAACPCPWFRSAHRQKANRRNDRSSRPRR